MTLNEIAKKMGARGKGILAADESTGTIAKRFRDSMHKSFNDKILTIGTSFISDHN